MLPVRVIGRLSVVAAALVASCGVRGQGLDPGGAPDDGDAGSSRSADSGAGATAGRGGATPTVDPGGRGGADAALSDTRTSGPTDGPIDRPPSLPDAPSVASDGPVDRVVGPVPWPDTGPPPTALLFVGHAMLDAGDIALRSRLLMHGFGVTVMTVDQDGDVTPARRAAVSAQLVVMSPSLPGGIGLPTALRDVATPIVCSRAASLDNLGFNADGSNGGLANQTQVQISNVAHPLAAGLTGAVTVTSQPSQLGYSMQPVPGAIRIATHVGSAERVAIVAFEKGAATRFGPAVARRVGVFPLEMSIPRLTPSGWALIDAAIKWASGR